MAKKTLSKPPKDVEKYLSGHLAGARLISAALDVLSLRRTVRVKWELKLRYYHTPEHVDNPKAIVRTMGGTMVSGGPIDGLEETGSSVAQPELLAAAKAVLAGLNARIDAAANGDGKVPVFDGIADLHSAIAKAEGRR
jgi:hypothetical protein